MFHTQKDSNLGHVHLHIHTSAVMAETTDFFFRTPNLTASNFAALRLTETLDFQLYITCTGATELVGQGGNLPIYVFEK